MRFSLSSAFVVAVLSNAAYIASAIPLSEQQCLQQFGIGSNKGGNNNAQTVTVTVSATAAAVTQTVTITNSAAAAASTSVDNSNSGSGVDNSNSGSAASNSGSGVDNSNAGSTAGSTAGNGAGSTAGNGADASNEQSSLTLDPSTIGPNLAQNGLGVNGSEAGQVASLTTTNNFINFCSGKVINNGEQFVTSTCNPVPMGDLPAKTNMINCKFTSPPNFGTLQSNTSFDISMAVTNFETGNFVNPNTNYFAAPQQLNAQGNIIGHSHFVIEKIASLTDTAVLDPTKFAYFKGVNTPAVDGTLTITVTGGLGPGTYRIASINTAANHQPALVPVAQHGSMDDIIYITVADNANAASASTDNSAAAANATATDSAAADNSTAAATDSAAIDNSTATDAAAATDSAAAATDSAVTATDSAVAATDSAAAATDSAVAATGSAAAATDSAAAATDSAATATDSAAASAAVAGSAAAAAPTGAAAAPTGAAAAPTGAAASAGGQFDTKSSKNAPKGKDGRRRRRFARS